MSLRSTYQFLLVVISSLCFLIDRAAAQQGALYFSAGYNKAWYLPGTIHIEQNEIGNSYNLVNVKGNNKTNTSFSFTQLNYRLGYYYNDVQTNGIEFSYDPFNYAIAGGQTVQQRGTINNRINASGTMSFPGTNGSYYYISGMNLMALNMVKRIRIYMANTKQIAVDAIVKIGAGPAFPHFSSDLLANPVDNKGFRFGGWNGAGEAGVRVRGYRYMYLELTAKYDYAAFDAMNIYGGTARQNISTIGVVASFGLTIPTTRSNPLFFREHNIITMLTFYQNRDKFFQTIPKKKGKLDDEGKIDSLGDFQPLDSIPEFTEILDKKYRREHPDTVVAVKVELDSLGNPVIRDSLGNIITRDSLGNFITRDSLGNITVRDSLGNIIPNSLTLKDSTGNGTDSNTEHLTRKQLKKKKKAEEKARKKQEKTLELNLEGIPLELKDPEGRPPEIKDTVVTDSVNKEPEVKKEPEIKDTLKKEPELKKESEVKDTLKQEPEIKPEEPGAPELSRKERKKKAREKKQAQEEKEKADKIKEWEEWLKAEQKRLDMLYHVVPVYDTNKSKTDPGH